MSPSPLLAPIVPYLPLILVVFAWLTPGGDWGFADRIEWVPAMYQDQVVRMEIKGGLEGWKKFTPVPQPDDDDQS